MTTNTDTLRKFLLLVRKAEALSRADCTDRTRYDLIFSSEIRDEIESTGIEIRWYNPDTTYEDDMFAYVNALTDKAKEVRAVLSALESVDDHD